MFLAHNYWVILIYERVNIRVNDYLLARPIHLFCNQNNESIVTLLSVSYVQIMDSLGLRKKNFEAFNCISSTWIIVIYRVKKRTLIVVHVNLHFIYLFLIYSNISAGCPFNNKLVSHGALGIKNKNNTETYTSQLRRISNQWWHLHAQ